MNRHERRRDRRDARLYIQQARHYIKKLQWEGRVKLYNGEVVTTRSFRGFKHVIKHCKYEIEVVYFVDPKEE